MAERLTPEAAGCWIEGHWGIYGARRLVEIAVSHGYRPVLNDKEQQLFDEAWNRSFGVNVVDIEVPHFLVWQNCKDFVQQQHDFIAACVRMGAGNPADLERARECINALTLLTTGQLRSVRNPCFREQLAAELVYNLSDEAEEWMNDNVAPEGFAFGWHDGEWFLWSIKEWQDVA
jgi:hypothetical protein